MTDNTPSIYSYTAGEWLSHWRDALLWDPVALFTVILGVSTIGLWLATRRLWRGAEAQAKDLIRSADAAEKSADAALASAEALTAQLRAYVAITTSGITAIDDAGPRVVEIEIENTGQTPAFDVTHWIGMGLQPYPLLEPLPPAPGETVLSRSTLFPRQGQIKRIEYPEPDQAAVAALKAGLAAYYVWGEVKYRDAFGKDRTLRYYRLQGGPNGCNGNALAASTEGDYSN